MATYSKTKSSFVSDEQMVQVKTTLEEMVESTTYNTQSSFSANLTRHPDNLICFVDKHMEYLASHRGIDPQHYVANLRLITRIR